MVTKVLISFVILLVVECRRYSETNEINVQSSEGFSIYIKSEALNNGGNECEMILKKSGKEYKFHAFGKNQTILTEFGSIEPVGGHDSGVIVRNVTASAQGIWQLDVQPFNSNSIYATKEVSVKILDFVKKKDHLDKIVDIFPENEKRTLDWYCARDNNYESSAQCDIIDMETGKRQNQCHKIIKFFNSFDHSNQICFLKSRGSTVFVERNLTVERNYTNNVAEQTIITNNYKNYTILSCRFNQRDLRSCFAVHVKSKKLVNIEDNLVGQRYSSYKTKMAGNLCQLEIPHPILENEIGTWKILTRLDRYSEEISDSGCIFNVVSDGSDEIEDLKNRIAIPQLIRTMDKQIKINCEEAPYPLKYCYLIDPNNQIIPIPQVLVSDDPLTAGSCIFENMISQSGVWKCGFNAPVDNEPDLIQDLQIRYYKDFKIVVEEEYVRLKQNKTLTLLCQTAIDIPIKTCMFFGPKGKIYNLPTSDFKTQNYKYFGRGLGFGVCGIKFLQTDQSFKGDWTCNIIVDPRTSIPSNSYPAKSMWTEKIHVI